MDESLALDERMDHDTNRSPLLTPNMLQDPWTSLQVESGPSLPRSKSDMDMSKLIRKPSSSALSMLSYNPPTSSRSDTFSQRMEEKSGGMRQLLSRSTKLLQKRKSSNRLRSMDWGSDNKSAEMVQRPKSRGGKLGSPFQDSHSRPFISDPYNFQHLTHTGPAHAKLLQTSNEHQLITEFSALRASQAAKPELKGIKANDIVASYDNSPIASRSPSPPQSPNQRVLRSIKSVDSFTRLNRYSNSFSSPHPPISPPPRGSSRQAPRISQGLGLNNIDTCLVQEVSTTPVGANHSPKSYFHQQPPTIEEPLSATREIAQAVTTPDDSAQLFITHQRNVSCAGLDDVPEEDEEAARLERIEGKSRDLRHARSFPARTSFQAALPQFGDDEIPYRSSKRISDNLVQTNWEDDIDYCYEHAMDADYDWVENAWNEAVTPEARPVVQTSPYPRNFSYLGGFANNDSATSSAVSIQGVATPSERVVARDSFMTTHSLLFPPTPPLPESKDLPNMSDSFHSRAGDSEASKEPKSYPSTIATETSPRSSGTGITKWSSRESLNTRATSMATTVSKHRQSNSVSSIPDFLPSGMSKPETSFYRSESTDNIAAKAPMAPPPPPTTMNPRSRANSDGANKLLDLAMIGAPAPIGSRSRAGSVATGKGRQSAAGSRVSYSLFPATSTAAIPPR